MNWRLLKAIVGGSIVLSHLGVLLWIFSLTRTYFTVKQAVDLAASIAPVLAVSLVIVIKDFLRKVPTHLPPLKAPLEFAVISFVLLSVYVLAITVCLTGFPQHIESVEELRTLFLAIESIFGVYVGYVIDVLFYRKGVRSTSRRKPSPVAPSAHQ